MPIQDKKEFYLYIMKTCDVFCSCTIYRIRAWHATPRAVVLKQNRCVQIKSLPSDVGNMVHV